ncbi:MAG: DUF4160 domain-containing protein [Coriobacteriales bacterium]
MPTLARFRGITVRMFYLAAEHNPPHVHAYCGGDAAAFDIRTRQILDGAFSQKEASLLREWIANNEEKLLELWETQQFDRTWQLS